jgi:hypothetical protein
MKKENIEKVLQDAWLGISVKDEDLFNPIDFIFHDGDTDKILERIAWLFMQPEYFSFTKRNVEQEVSNAGWQSWYG